MSGSINIDPSQVQRLDFVHWSAPGCPGDNYGQVLDLLDNSRIVVAYGGVRKFIYLSQITAAIRNELPHESIPNLNPLCAGTPFGKPIVKS